MKKTAYWILLLLAATLVPAEAATLKLRMVIVNPSTTKTQTKSVKSYLPKEVALKDVKDAGGLDLDYDAEKSLLYVSKDVDLSPGETKTFEIMIDDVWVVAEDKLTALETRTNRVMEKLKDTPYFEQADLLAKTILGRLTEIAVTQNDTNVTRQQHIAYYRDNLRAMEGVLADLERLEKILVTAGGPPNIELMENSDVNLKSPSTKTTWMLIFIILIFISILGGAFYFTWQGQARVTENIFMREKDAAFSEFKTPPDKKP